MLPSTIVSAASRASPLLPSQVEKFSFSRPCSTSRAISQENGASLL
jgi:hypothetical protein